MPMSVCIFVHVLRKSSKQGMCGNVSYKCFSIDIKICYLSEKQLVLR